MLRNGTPGFAVFTRLAAGWQQLCEVSRGSVKAMDGFAQPALDEKLSLG